ncbi:GyrI-like domain-containing protein [Paenibacillus harenae]|uniref:GyrI-like domain-containing protein n=1 Tax=Paenibacillus harenae TaxID=306543 RepID=UPI00041DA93B|nr:GyrI-like domain-containing protein [Paenibacillus harenae]
MSEPVMNVGTAGEVEILTLGEMKFVGFPVNVSFKDGDFSKIGRTKQLFMERKSEIRHAVDPETYWAPWYNCEVMFTYFYCLQVSGLADIPEGMMGFAIPESRYAAVRYEGPHPWEPSPYALLAEFREANRISAKENGMVLEKYRFDDDCKPGEHISIDVLGPIV